MYGVRSISFAHNAKQLLSENQQRKIVCKFHIRQAVVNVNVGLLIRSGNNILFMW